MEEPVLVGIILIRTYPILEVVSFPQVMSISQITWMAPVLAIRILCVGQAIWDLPPVPSKSFVPLVDPRLGPGSHGITVPLVKKPCKCN